MHFIQRRTYLRPFMHAIVIVACMKVHTSKMMKKYLRLYFCPFSDLFHPFLKKIDLLHSCARIWTTVLIELNWITLFKVSYVIAKLHNSSRLLKAYLNNANEYYFTFCIIYLCILICVNKCTVYCILISSL